MMVFLAVRVVVIVFIHTVEVFMSHFPLLICVVGDDFKCPITCEVMRDPVVASGMGVWEGGGGREREGGREEGREEGAREGGRREGGRGGRREGGGEGGGGGGRGGGGGGREGGRERGKGGDEEGGGMKHTIELRGAC